MTAVRTAGGTSFDDYPDLYERFTAAADRCDGGEFHRWLLAQLPGGQRLLDVGCGAGRLSAVLAGVYHRVLAVDPSTPQIDLARRLRPHRNVEYAVRGLADLTPDEVGRFDAVLAAFVVHHAGPPPEVLGRLRELLVPRGRLVVVDVVDPGGWTDPGWQQDRAWATARALYEASGETADVAAVLRLFLDPRWLAQCARSVPLTPARFDAEYQAALPGVTIVPDLRGDGTVRAAVWTASG